VWSRRDGTWYYQRGYIVKRPAKLEGFDDAVLEVGGLALYVWGGSGWSFQKELVTWNTYEGIPEPDGDALLALVKSATMNWMPMQVVGTPQNHRMADPVNFEWHDAKSVSFNFIVDAQQVDWPSSELRQSTLTVRSRVYRDSADAPWRDPLQPELIDAKVNSAEKKTREELAKISAG